MKTALIILLTLAAASTAARAQAPTSPLQSPTSPFEIKDIKKTTGALFYMDNQWRRNAPAIEVGLRSNEDLSGKKPFEKAYFFDKDRKLITKVTGTSYGAPDWWKPKETYKVLFGISEQALDSHRKWARVLIVFGEGNRAVAEVYPSDDPTLFEFDEKAFATVKRK